MIRRPTLRVFFLAPLAIGLVACTGAPSATPEPSVGEVTGELAANTKLVDNCSGGRFHCFSKRIVDATTGFIAPHAGSLGATDLESAYAIDKTWNSGLTIAIIDAFDYPNAESDLASYRSMYGLPACTVANGCLTIVNQDGSTTPLPANAPANDDWTGETALDLDMASAACPNCKIAPRAQADDDQGDGLLIAQADRRQARRHRHQQQLGRPRGRADTGRRRSTTSTLTTHAAIFVASGDDGYNDGGQGPDYPSTSAYAIGVGGTTPGQDGAGTRGWTEKAWCVGRQRRAAKSIPKPSFQTDASCTFRAASDVSAVGDPTPASRSTTTAAGSWSAAPAPRRRSSPAIFAAHRPRLRADASCVYQNPTRVLRRHHRAPTAPAARRCARPGTGWDGPTGIGTPNGARC